MTASGRSSWVVISSASRSRTAAGSAFRTVAEPAPGLSAAAHLPDHGAHVDAAGAGAADDHALVALQPEDAEGRVQPADLLVLGHYRRQQAGPAGHAQGRQADLVAVDAQGADSSSTRVRTPAWSASKASPRYAAATWMSAPLSNR